MNPNPLTLVDQFPGLGVLIKQPADDRDCRTDAT